MSSAMPGPQQPPPSTVVVPVPSAEPGYLTTEFWVTVGTQAVGLLLDFGVIHWSGQQQQDVAALLTLILPQAFYAISRGIRKQGTQG